MKNNPLGAKKRALIRVLFFIDFIFLYSFNTLLSSN